MNVTMFEVSLSFINDYLRDKELIQIVRKVLDPLLSISVSSYIFERYYFTYQWLDITDYKLILSFFVKGNFVIPLTIFFVVHLSIDMLVGMMINIVDKPIAKYMENIVASNVEKENFKIALNKFERLRQELDTLEKEKPEIELVLRFILRSIVVTLFYFCILPNYGILLFTMMLVLLLVALVNHWFVYLGLNFLASIITKLETPDDKIA